MIVFDLACGAGHRFEGWFGSSADYDRQRDAAMIACPSCGSAEVGKAVMAPAIGRKGNRPPVPAPASSAAPASGAVAASAKPQRMANPPLPPRMVEMMRVMATMQAKALERSRWVGDSFADEARAQHYGERERETIHGEATLADAEELAEEGIVVMPLPFPVAGPGEAN